MHSAHFPAARWKYLRTTNAIESKFRTVRHQFNDGFLWMLAIDCLRELKSEVGSNLQWIEKYAADLAFKTPCLRSSAFYTSELRLLLPLRNLVARRRRTGAALFIPRRAIVPEHLPMCLGAHENMLADCKLGIVIQNARRDHV